MAVDLLCFVVMLAPSRHPESVAGRGAAVTTGRRGALTPAPVQQRIAARQRIEAALQRSSARAA